MPMRSDMSRTARVSDAVFPACNPLRTTCILVGLLALMASAACAADETPAPETRVDATIPTLEQVTAEIEQHFRSQKSVEPGDLIARSNVKAALDRVRDLGWEVPQRAALEKLVLPDDAFVVS